MQLYGFVPQNIHQIKWKGRFFDENYTCDLYKCLFYGKIEFKDFKKTHTRFEQKRNYFQTCKEESNQGS